MNIKKLKKIISPVILCGGKGQRLKPLTQTIPKSLVKINGEEILSYIIKHLKFYNLENIVVLCGYKKIKIRKFIKKKFNDKIKYIDTGLNTDILDRLRKAKKNYREYILICYG